MSSSWNKGLTKNTSLSVKKISETMKRKRIDNFRVWRNRMKSEGKIKSIYKKFERNDDLAELIGVVLGDGHICKFKRTESLKIVANFSNPGFIKRYANLMEKIFEKKPYVSKRKRSNAVDITIYEKYISERLGIPSGARGNLIVKIPNWILRNKKYILRYLRGLYEAEGNFSVHLPTYTHKFQFSNRNNSMIQNVYKLMKILGFHPHISNYQVQISKKAEVYKAVELLKFRKY